jgi:hypothetical protein
MYIISDCRSIFLEFYSVCNMIFSVFASTTTHLTKGLFQKVRTVYFFIGFCKKWEAKYA